MFPDIVKNVWFWTPSQTPTSGGRVDLRSKIVFLILVWDETIFKKGGLVWVPFYVRKPETPTSRGKKVLVKDCIPNIGLG